MIKTATFEAWKETRGLTLQRLTREADGLHVRDPAILRNLI